MFLLHSPPDNGPKGPKIFGFFEDFSHKQSYIFPAHFCQAPTCRPRANSIIHAPPCPGKNRGPARLGFFQNQTVAFHQGGMDKKICRRHKLRHPELLAHGPEHANPRVGLQSFRTIPPYHCQPDFRPGSDRLPCFFKNPHVFSGVGKVFRNTDKKNLLPT